MRSYDWCCFSCGSANEAALGHCGACGCPAKAKVAEVEHYRNAFEQNGRVILNEATHLHERPQLSAFQLLLVPLGAVLFGWVPSADRPLKQVRAAPSEESASSAIGMKNVA